MTTILTGIAIGICLGYASGGNLTMLRKQRLRGESWLLVMLVIQILLPFLPSSSSSFVQAGYYLWLLSFVFMLGLSVANLASPGLPAVALGSALNLTVILSNKGMPVSLTAMLHAGYSGNPLEAFTQSTWTHLSLADTTRLAVFADVMPLPGPRLVEGVVSVGDMLLVAGVVVFIVSGMTYTRQMSEQVEANRL